MDLRKPPLYGVHEDRGARFTGFGGWEMPVEFDSIREEHRAVREEAGIFDVSHMGQVTVSGPDAAALLQRLTTNDVTALDPGEAQYAAITDEDGVILDDTIVYRLPSDRDEDYLFVPNAGHDEEMHDRWTDHRDEWDLDATVSNETADYAMVAVQGPDAEERLVEAVGPAARDLQWMCAATVSIAGVECVASRSGYTGEDGFEVMAPVEDAEAVWSAFDCQPCGLGARDTLRMEAGYLLSGQDFHHEENPRNPYEAGIGFAVKLDTEFVGRDALEGVHAEGPDEKFVGVKLVDRGIPRTGYEIADVDGTVVGEVTSGTMSPTLGDPIGLGYVPAEYADPGTKVRVVIRGEPKKAKIHTPRFVE